MVQAGGINLQCREPGENRYRRRPAQVEFAFGAIEFSPNKNWTMQVSYGFLRSPENQEPDVEVR